jgi:hypothetical protein
MIVLKTLCDSYSNWKTEQNYVPIFGTYSAPAAIKVSKTFGAATGFFEHVLRSAGAWKFWCLWLCL